MGVERPAQMQVLLFMYLWPRKRMLLKCDHSDIAGSVSENEILTGLAKDRSELKRILWTELALDNTRPRAICIHCRLLPTPPGIIKLDGGKPRKMNPHLWNIADKMWHGLLGSTRKTEMIFWRLCEEGRKSVRELLFSCKTNKDETCNECERILYLAPCKRVKKEMINGKFNQKDI
jgi:hypothetical protein